MAINLPLLNADSQRLMIQLSKLAGMAESPLRRMVLVLEIDAAPVMYVESLTFQGYISFDPVDVKVVDKSDDPAYVDRIIDGIRKS